MTSDTITLQFSVQARGPEATGVEGVEWWDISIIRLAGECFPHHDDALPTSLRFSSMDRLHEVADPPIVTFTGLQHSGFELGFFCQSGAIQVPLDEIVRILDEDLGATVTCVIE